MASSSDCSSSSSSSSFSAPFSLHRSLGGGRAADLMTWRRRSASASVLVGVTAAWLALEYGGYSFLSLLANSLLLLVAVLFFWAKSASLLSRPLPPLPNMELSNHVVEKIVDKFVTWINAVLSIGHNIAIESNKILFFKVVLILYFVSYFGSFLEFTTLIYIGFLLSMTLPYLYTKYQDPIDKKLRLARALLRKEVIFSHPGGSTGKEKKT